MWKLSIAFTLSFNEKKHASTVKTAKLFLWCQQLQFWESNFSIWHESLYINTVGASMGILRTCTIKYYFLSHRPIVSQGYKLLFMEWDEGVCRGVTNAKAILGCCSNWSDFLCIKLCPDSSTSFTPHHNNKSKQCGILLESEQQSLSATDEALTAHRG